MQPQLSDLPISRFDGSQPHRNATILTPPRSYTILQSQTWQILSLKSDSSSARQASG